MPHIGPTIRPGGFQHSCQRTDSPEVCISSSHREITTGNLDFQPTIVWLIPGNGKLEVVGREGGSDARTFVVFVAVEGEDAEGAADLGAAEGGGFAFGERTEFASAALDDVTGEVIWEGGGFGARALRVRKDMEVGERQALDEGKSGGVVGLGFAREAGDDVGADGGVGEKLMDQLDAAGVMLGAVPAVHGGEDAVGAGLQRHMEVLGDAVG